MQFIKLTERQAVPIEQIQSISEARGSYFKSEVVVLRDDGRVKEYNSTKTVSKLVDEINAAHDSK